MIISIINGLSYPANVAAALGDIPHPLARRLRALDVLQRFNLQSGYAVIGYFKTEIDGAGLLDGLTGSGLGKRDFGHYGVFVIAGHLLDDPFDGVGGLVVVHSLVSLVFDHLGVDVRDLFGHVEANVDERCHYFLRIG